MGITLVHKYCWYATYCKRTSLWHVKIYFIFSISRHGNHKVFSCRGIELCINYFKRKGHTQITALVPQSRTRFPSQDKPIKDQHILEELREQGMLSYTPARRVGGKNIKCYDDKYVYM